jgi:hypothetical protein
MPTIGSRLGAFATAMLCIALTAAGSASAAVDAALVGTWQLQWQGAAIYWALREDGVYRLYGLGANPGQLGELEAAGGKFSMKAAFFADAGTYELRDSETWIVTGRLGPGIWKRVWHPAAEGGTIASTSGACGLVTAAEVASVLREPVRGAAGRGDPPECVLQAALSDFHRVTVRASPSRRQAWEIKRAEPNPSMMTVRGIAEDAYAVLDGGGHLVLDVLHGGTELRITLTMKPGATPQDLPLLAALARAADGRLGIFGTVR